MEPGLLSGVPAFPEPIPYVRPTLPAVAEIAAPLAATLGGGMLTNGPNVRRLEERLSEYLEVHCVCVASGTMALYLAASCLLGPRARVLVPAYTFAATALAFVMGGARVALADVEEGSWCLDPEALEPSVLARVDCLVPVNVFGNPPAAERMDALAAAAGQVVIHDSAQGMGSERRGRRVGGFGHAEAFSLHATKVLACGEGGVVATRDEPLAREVRLRRNFGLLEHVVRATGTNGKMQELSAILGLWGLDRLDAWLARRARLAELYRERLRVIPGLRLQETAPGDRSNHVNFAVLVEDGFGLGRDQLRAALAADNVVSRASLAPELSAHPGLAEVASPVGGRPLARARRIAGGVLCLPIYSHQREEEVHLICDCLCRIHEAAGRVRARLESPAALAAGAEVR